MPNDGAWRFPVLRAIYLGLRLHEAIELLHGSEIHRDELQIRGSCRRRPRRRST